MLPLVAASAVPAQCGTPSEGSLRSSLREIGYFLGYLWPQGRLAAGVLLLSLVAQLLRLPILCLPAVLTAHFEAGGQADGDWFGRATVAGLRAVFGSSGYLTGAVVLTGASILLLAPLHLLRSYWNGLLGANLLLQLRHDIFARLRSSTMAAVYERGAAAFVQRLTRDLFALSELFAGTLPGVVNLLIQVAVFLGVLLLIEPGLTVVVLLTFCALQPVLLSFNRRIQRQADRLQELHEGVTALMLECIGGYRDIVAAGYFERMGDRFRARTAELRREGIRALLYSQSSELLLGVAFGALTVVPYFIALGRLDRVEEVGRMITYVGLVSGLLPALAGLWGTTIDLALATPSLRALRTMLALDEAPRVVAAVRSAPPPSGQVRRIRFEGVGLRVGDRWIVRDLNFEIAGGELTALIGESGAGKTTIFHLLLRLVEPTCGVVWFDDAPLSELAEADLRRLIGFIPQNPFIFNASLRDNLLVAATLPEQPDALLAEVVEAAQLEPLIRARDGEGGLDSGAGYLGMRLSGGERQRIALGRLLVQDPRIIVCDEYTANIDVKTAQLIQEMMRTRFAGRTRLVITHELYNARGADRVLVLDRGRIVQSGTPKELLAAPGLYRTMWETQRLE